MYFKKKSYGKPYRHGKKRYGRRSSRRRGRSRGRSSSRASGLRRGGIRLQRIYMACFYPITGYRSRQLTEKGKRKLVFNKVDGYVDLPVTVACGRCIGCRLERSRQWAIRCVHEASMHTDNCFLTLTYNDENLPADGTLVLKHWQDFMKRMRKKYGTGIRFFHCGEYGRRGGRPHYHACIFGFAFSDLVLWREKKGVRLYTSKSLDKLWGKGFATVGEVSFESAAYVARYIVDKINGEKWLSDDEHICKGTGEISFRKREYVTMSRGCKALGTGGIGKAWYEKYSSDVYPQDLVVLRGRKMKPPRFYDNLYEIDNPEGFKKMKGSRIAASKKQLDNQTPERLQVREKVQKARLNKLVRPLED